jgi:hypothetical protein
MVRHPRLARGDTGRASCQASATERNGSLKSSDSLCCNNDGVIIRTLVDSRTNSSYSTFSVHNTMAGRFHY